MSFEEMWRDLTPVGRSASSGGYFRQPWESAELELRVEQRTRALEERSEELRRVERMRQHLIEMIVHDLNNPLTTLFGAIEMLESHDKGLTPEFRKRVLQCGRISILELERLVYQLGCVGRLERGATIF